jgi:hypothetical protein
VRLADAISPSLELPNHSGKEKKRNVEVGNKQTNKQKRKVEYE